MASIENHSQGTGLKENSVTREFSLRSLINRQEMIGSSSNGLQASQNRTNVTFHDEIAFEDTNTRVIIHRLIDEGEFRCVYMARDVRTSQLYALKRIDCTDKKRLDQCRKEVAIHRLFHHANIMPLLGVKFVHDDYKETEATVSRMVCYMRFPYVSRSLADDIVSRRLWEDVLESKRRPYSRNEALTLFAGIVSAVNAMHEAGYSHRDIRVENILLQKNQGQKRKRRHHLGTPVLTDLGSVGPATVAVESLEDARLAMEDIESNTTVSYRAPELFAESIFSAANNGPSNSIHYDYADMWSLGCLLFAVLYGTTPFEVEWGISFIEGAEAEGAVRYIGSPTLQKVLEPVPFPPCDSAADRRYNNDFNDLIRWILKVSATERPTTNEVLERVSNFLGEKSSEEMKRA